MRSVSSPALDELGIEWLVRRATFAAAERHGSNQRLGQRATAGEAHKCLPAVVARIPVLRPTRHDCRSSPFPLPRTVGVRLRGEIPRSRDIVLSLNIAESEASDCLRALDKLFV